MGRAQESSQEGLGFSRSTGKGFGSFPHQLCALCTAWVPTAASLNNLPKNPASLCSPHGSVFMGNVDVQIQLLLMPQSTGLQGEHSIIYPISLPSLRVWNTVEGKIFAHINASTFSMGKSSFHQGKVLAHSLSWKGERRVAGFCTDCKSH